MTTHGLRRFLCLCLLLPGINQAAPAESRSTDGDTTHVTNLGNGPSRDEAIAAALAQAVIQVQGKDVPFDVLHKMFLGAQREERMVRMSVMNDTRIRATRISPAVAFVQDYQVSASHRDEDTGAWQATVAADVVLPAARLARRQETTQVALLPFEYMQEEESEAGPPSAQATLKQTLADLVAFQRNVESLLAHQDRIKVHPVPANAGGNLEKAADTPAQVDWKALASATGATHFITVQAEDFRTEAVKLKGNITTARLDAGFTLHYRLIRADRDKPEIEQSGTFTVDTRSPYLHPLAMTDSNAPAAPAVIQARIAALRARVAQLFANTLLAEMVMPQVVAREGDAVVLQPGASQLRPGDQMAVLGPDVSEQDSTMGMLVREDGMRIAVLQVTQVDGGRPVARVLKGNAFAVQPGSLLRRIGSGSTGVAAAAIPATEAAAKPASATH